jgi:hypothetical protein
MRSRDAGIMYVGPVAMMCGSKWITAASIAACWPQMASTCVMVPIRTENKLHFTARLAYEADSLADLHIQLLPSGGIQRQGVSEKPS